MRVERRPHGGLLWGQGAIFPLIKEQWVAGCGHEPLNLSNINGVISTLVGVGDGAFKMCQRSIEQGHPEFPEAVG